MFVNVSLNISKTNFSFVAGDFTSNVDIMNMWVKAGVRKVEQSGKFRKLQRSSEYVSKYNDCQHVSVGLIVVNI